jgi:hypothetical protein
MGVNESNVADITRSNKSALRLPTGVTPFAGEALRQAHRGVGEGSIALRVLGHSALTPIAESVLVPRSRRVEAGVVLCARVGERQSRRAERSPVGDRSVEVHRLSLWAGGLLGTV